MRMKCRVPFCQPPNGKAGVSGVSTVARGLLTSLRGPDDLSHHDQRPARTLRMTKQPPLEVTVTEDPITGTWTFTLHGHCIEVERTHGFIKIDTTIHKAPLVQELKDVQDLAGAPLDYITTLLTTTAPPEPKARHDHTRLARPTKTDESQRRPAAAAPIEEPMKPRRTKRQDQAPPIESGMPATEPQPSGERVVLTTEQAGVFLGLSPTTLETLRTRGGGPPFVKLGRRVGYRRDDLTRWLGGLRIACGAPPATRDSNPAHPWGSRAPRPADNSLHEHGLHRAGVVPSKAPTGARRQGSTPRAQLRQSRQGEPRRRSGSFIPPSLYPGW